MQMFQTMCTLHNWLIIKYIRKQISVQKILFVLVFGFEFEHLQKIQRFKVNFFEDPYKQKYNENLFEC